MATPPKPKRRRLKKAALAALAGLLLGFTCPYWPEKLQPACQLASKIIGLFFGGV